MRQLDVSKYDEISKLFAEGKDGGLPEEFRDIDILVDNAGFMSGYERAPDIPNEVFEGV